MTTETGHWIETPEPGIYPAKDVPAELYHRWDAISNSWLGILDNESPKAFAACRRKPRVPTPAMKFGSMLHKLVLEGFDFAKEFAVAPECDKRTKAGKKTWGDFVAGAGDRIVVPTTGQYGHAVACRVAKAIKEEHPTAPRMLMGGQAEVSIVWIDEITGIKCKARLDYLNSHLIPDVKSTASVHPPTFTKSIYFYGYHRQSYMYREAVRAALGEDRTSVIIAGEKQEPFDVLARPVGETVLRAGQESFRRAMALYKRCRDADEWPGYDGKEGTTETFELPEFVLRQEGLVA